MLTRRLADDVATRGCKDYTTMIRLVKVASLNIVSSGGEKKGPNDRCVMISRKRVMREFGLFSGPVFFSRPPRSDGHRRKRLIVWRTFCQSRLCRRMLLHWETLEMKRLRYVIWLFFVLGSCRFFWFDIAKYSRSQNDFIRSRKWFVAVILFSFVQRNGAKKRKL